MKPSLLLVGTDCLNTRLIYHALKGIVEWKAVIIEEPVSKYKLLKGRAKRIGWFKVLGQLSFIIGLAPILKFVSKKRIQAILSEFNLVDRPIPTDKIIAVQSINSDLAREQIAKYKVDAFMISGTRIISQKTLSATEAPFVNMHVGITPQYRGVHGGYWALFQNDPENCGVTIHLIDKGIDTGNIIAQKTIQPQANDNYSTYPILQSAVGIELLKELFSKFSKPIPIVIPSISKSNLWYHPTIWEYLYYRIRFGVK